MARTDALVILVVEDEPILRIDLASHLANAGHEVLEAASGEEAVALVTDAVAIDVVVTDIRLGGTLSGWDVGETAVKVIPGAAVIFVSGTSLTPPREVPGALYIEKPYDLETIRLACEGRQLRLVRQ